MSIDPQTQPGVEAMGSFIPTTEAMMSSYNMSSKKFGSTIKLMTAY